MFGDRPKDLFGRFYLLIRLCTDPEASKYSERENNVWKVSFINSATDLNLDHNLFAYFNSHAVGRTRESILLWVIF